MWFSNNSTACLHRFKTVRCSYKRQTKKASKHIDIHLLSVIVKNSQNANKMIQCFCVFCLVLERKLRSFCEILNTCGDLFYWQANNLENTLHIPWVSLGYLHLLSVTSLDLLIVAKLQIFDNKIYGSVSAGRGEWLFRVLFFQKVKPPCDFTW